MRVFENGVYVDQRVKKLPDFQIGDRVRIKARSYRGQNGTISIGKSGNVLTSKGAYVALDNEDPNDIRWFKFTSIEKMDKDTETVVHTQKNTSTIESDSHPVSPTNFNLASKKERREQIKKLVDNIIMLQEQLRQLLLDDYDDITLEAVHCK